MNSPQIALLKTHRGMGILPMRNNPARHGQDAHATGAIRKPLSSPSRLRAFAGNSCFRHTVAPLCVFLLSLCTAAAQPEKEAPPPDPQIVRLPDAIQWVITFGSKDAAPPAGDIPRPATITTTKFGGLRRVVSTWTSGDPTEFWYVGNMRVSQRNGRIEVSDSLPEPGSSGDMASHVADLPQLAWVSRATFVKSDRLIGKTCSYYETTKQMPGFPALKLRAWIDEKTRLPVAYFDGETQWNYAFSPFSGPLALPPALAAKVLEFQKRVEVEAQRRSRVP